MTASFSENQPDFAFLHVLADLAAENVMPLFRAPITIENKLDQGFDPVTDADRQAEIVMRAAISERFADHGILGEEYDAKDLDAEGLWILDPIDGTRAYITGLPTWGTLIGYTNRATGHQLGMMSQPFTGERYFGDGKKSFYRNQTMRDGGQRSLKCRSCDSIAQATLFTTSPHLFDAAEWPAYERVEKSVRMARYGIDCYAYCMVALGFADLVVEAGLKAVDIGPLIPVIEGAGGIVTDWQGNSAWNGGQVVAAGDRALHEQVLALLNDKA